MATCIRKEVQSSIEVIENIVIMGARDNECAKSRTAFKTYRQRRLFMYYIEYCFSGPHT